MDQPVRGRPPAPPENKDRGSLLPVVVTAVFVVGIITMIVAFTGWAGVLALVAISVLPGFILMHYVLWGWWLKKYLAQQKIDDDEPSRPGRR